MDLVPVVSDAPGPAASPGVRVNQGFLQSFGVRTTRVERGASPVAIRTVGALAHNERNVVVVDLVAAEVADVERQAGGQLELQEVLVLRREQYGMAFAGDPNWLAPQVIMPGRLAKVALQLDF